MRIHVGEAPKPRLRDIWRAEKGVTAAELAIVLAILIIASGAVGSSRFQPAKDESCFHPQSGCMMPRGVRLLQRQNPAEGYKPALMNGPEARTFTSPLTGSSGQTDR